MSAPAVFIGSIFAFMGGYYMIRPFVLKNMTVLEKMVDFLVGIFFAVLTFYIFAL